MDALISGTKLASYRIEQVLGQGGFGIVYRARHAELGVRVAIKEYLPIEIAIRTGENVRPRAPAFRAVYEDGLARFKEEALRLVEFSDHPNIVSCRDFFRLNGTAYLVMEYEDALPLSHLLRTREAQSRPFIEDDLLTVMLPLLDGLRSLHSSGVLHRDIKPSNVLIRYSTGQPVLIDFGAAKQRVAEQTKSYAPYTPGYAAFEQVADGTLGPWTDIYGVGALMWRMVAKGSPLNPVKVERRASAILRRDDDPMTSAVLIGEGRFRIDLLQAIDGCLVINEHERVRNTDELTRLLKTDGYPHRKTEDAPLSLLKGTSLHWAAWAGTRGRILELLETGSKVDARGMDGMTPLYWAAWAGQEDAIKTLIECGATVDSKDESDRTPLHRTTWAGNRRSIALLAESGADVRARDRSGKGILDFALKSGRSQILDAVQAAGVDINSNDINCKTLLHDAADQGSPEQIYWLLGRGFQLEAENRWKETPMHRAALGNKPKNLEALIAAGAEVDPLDVDGGTPLHLAARNSHAAAMRVLIDSGADVNRPEAAADSFGYTPLHLVAKSYGGDSVPECIHMLARAGADINVKSSSRYWTNGATPLHSAARVGTIDGIRALLALNANVRATDSVEGSCLHSAAWGRHPDAVSMLIDAGADVNARAKGGATPLHWLAARRTGKPLLGRLLDSWESLRPLGETHGRPFVTLWAEENEEGVAPTIDRLVQAGADINFRTDQGATPLHWAAQGEGSWGLETPAIEALLASGADVHSKTEDGRTPLHVATAPTVIEALVEGGSDLEARDNKGNTTLHVACMWWGLDNPEDPDFQHKTQESIPTLINSGADVDARNQRGLTPLHIAAAYWNSEAVKLLLHNRVEVDPQWHRNAATPLHCTFFASPRPAPKPEMEVKTVKALLDGGARVDARLNSDCGPNSHKNALHLAATYGHETSVSLLTTASVDIDSKDARGLTALNLASPNKIKINSLLNAGASVALWIRNTPTALHRTAEAGSMAGILRLVAEGIDIDTQDNDGDTPLHRAIRWDKTNSIKTLLQLGANPNIPNSKGLTTLHLAGRGAKSDYVGRLLRNGANPHIRDSSDMTALHLVAKLSDDVTDNCQTDAQHASVQERVESTIEQLCKAGCSPNQRAMSSSTALHIVAEYNSRAIIECDSRSSVQEIRQRATTVIASLIGHGAGIDVRDRFDRTPLQIAALWGSTDSVKALIKAGADINVRLKNNWTLLHLVSVSFQSVVREYKGWFKENEEFLNDYFEPLETDGEWFVQWYAQDPTDLGIRTMTKESIDAIIRSGCDIDARDEMGRTPLHLACKMGTPDRIESILDASSDPEVRDNYGLVAWDYLRSRKDVDWEDPSRPYLDLFERLNRQLKLWDHLDG